MSVVKIDQNVAVRVRNGCKSYGNNTVLDNLNMTVQAGSTYALLGSSGCGKTTLLSSLIGIQKLGSGSVQLFGQDASQADISSLVGFMPQETGLHGELTFSEELHYYGRLYGLDWTETEERLTFFMNLLQLEDVVHRQIRNMSGGQSRRVSLAVTLLHRPSLLILDEPTVGVDPLLRESIWKHLYALVKEENATIIVSTHYTEEARQADVVSVMRNGKLLVEEHPASLMLRYGSDLLEEVVVKLCRSQENGKERSRVTWLSRNLQKIYAMFILNLILVIRNPSMIVFQIFLPTIIMVLAWGVYNQDPYADIGVVNLEQPNCFGLLKPDEQKLGCELSHYLQNSNALNVHEYPSEEAALEAVHWGKNYGYILFPSNYSRNLQNRVAFGRFADEEILSGSTISARLDISNYLRNLFLVNGLIKGMEGFADKKLNTWDENEEGKNLAASLKPFKSNQKMKELGAIEGTWGYFGAISRTSLFTWIMPTAIVLTLIQEKKQGSLLRMLVGGGSMEHLFIGTMAASFLSMFIAQVGLLLGTGFVLEIPFKGSIFDYVIVNYGQSLGGLSFGFFLGAVFNQHLEAIFVIMGLAMLAMQCLLTDLSSITPWMQWFVLSLPTKVPAMSMENIMFRGWSMWSHFGVSSCFIVQAVWILSSLVLAKLSFGNE